MFQQVRQFPLIVWVIILGTFLSRFTFFMVWPFLAVILYKRFAMSDGSIGLILGLGALTGTTVGLWMGNLSDRLGRGKIVLAGCWLNILAFLAMAMASNVYIYIFAIIATGVGRALLEPPGKALISDAIDDIAVRELAFHLRYYILNIGAASGPIVGMTLGLVAEQQTFFLTAFTYVLYVVGLIVALRRDSSHSRPRHAGKGQNSLRATLAILAQDKAFQLLVLANILAMLCYAQVDSPLLQYLRQGGNEYAVSMMIWLIVTNAGTVVLLQFPMLKLMSKWPLDARINVSLMLLALAFLMFALIPIKSAWLWICAMAVLSAGEVILFPTLNLKTDRLAPPHLKGSYFGAAGLYGYGVALGPVVGGMMLQYFDGPVLWLLMVVLTLTSLALVRLSSVAPRPQFEQEMV